jgi:hypothetical protein
MPTTIGNTGAGADGSTLIDSVIAGSLHTTPSGSSVEIEKLTAKFTVSSGHEVKAAIYTTGDNVVANSEIGPINVTSNGSWDFVYAGTKPSLSPSTSYRLVVWAINVLGTCNILFDNGTTDQGGTDSETYSVPGGVPFPDPASFTNNNNNYAIYATVYEPSVEPESVQMIV